MLIAPASDDDAQENLTVYVHAHVARILFDESGDALKATGVEFLYPDNSTGILRVAKEVILTAGTVQTPQVLELSGIGDPDILKPLGIAVKYANKGVGANVQDHPTVFTTWSVEPEYYEQTIAAQSNATFLAEVIC